MFQKFFNSLFFLVALLIFSQTSTFSQGLYFSLEGGPGIPLGKFSSQTQEGAGYAKIGFNGAASAGYKFSDQMSAGVRAIFTQNKLDDSNSIFSEISPWNSTSILAAIKTSYAITDFLYAEGEINTGIMILNYPVGNISLGGINIGQEERTGNGVVLGAGAGLKINIMEDFAFKFGVHYVGGKPSYTSGNRDFSQRIDLLLLNFGIVFEMY